ncbi:MAG: RHS repeat protein [Actinobacteria bacterium]|nr:RHS repeat protein [Actinomycetota bacterium]
MGYDANGRRRTMTDGGGTSQWTWDSLGRLRSSTTRGATVAYGYDLADNLTTLTYPGGTNSVTRTHYDNGELHTVSDWLGHTTTFTPDGTADLAVWRPANGTWHLRGQAEVVLGTTGDTPVPARYDHDGKADVAVWHPAVGATWTVRASTSATFGYDTRGNRTSTTPTAGAASTSTYDQAECSASISMQTGRGSPGSRTGATRWTFSSGRQRGPRSKQRSTTPAQTLSLTKLKHAHGRSSASPAVSVVGREVVRRAS